MFSSRPSRFGNSAASERGSGLSVAWSSESLLELAKSKAPADRERLLVGIVELCDAGDGAAVTASPQVKALLDSIFLGLVASAERDIRQRLAEKLSTADWAPPAMLNVLALDEIEIARPIIAASPVLQDADLIRLLVEATVEHQIEVARRPNIGADVVAAILRAAEPAVLTALAGNHSAEVGPAEMGELVQAAREIASLRSPLARHPRLTGELALQLYAWVGQALRQALAERFRLDPALLDTALAQSVAEAHTGDAGSPADDGGHDADRESMELRLVEKLHAAGQLRPGYLVRSLQEGRLSLFVFALATLGRFEPKQVRQVIGSEKPELLGLACAAVGIDRSVFPSILEMVRGLNEGRPGGGADGARRAIGAFGPVSPQVAGAAFRQAATAV